MAIAEQARPLRVPAWGMVHGRTCVAIVILLAVSPLPFGSARPWAVYLLAMAVGLLALAAGVAALRQAPPRAVRWDGRLWAVALPYAAVCVWALVQALPNMAGSAHPVWRIAAEAGVADGLDSISANPAAGTEALVRLATAGLLFVLVCRIAVDRDVARRLVTAVAVISAAYSIYGIAVTLSGANAILWLERWSHPGSLTSTFVSRNSYAVYAGLGLLCSVAALTLRFGSAGRHGHRSRRHLLALLERADAGAAYVAIALLCNLSALLLTQSRAGTVAAALGLAVLIGLLWVRRPRQPVVNLALAALGGIVLTYGIVGGAGLFQRLASEDIAANERFAVYEITLRAIADRPWLGHGLATFEDVFRIYRTSDITLYWDRDHNTYLGMALELGIPAAAAMGLTFVLLGLRCVAGVWRRRRDVALPALGPAALVLVGANAVLDFSIEIPAIAVLLGVILAVAYVQSWPTAQR